MDDETDMRGLGAYADRLLRRREQRYARSWKRSAAERIDPEPVETEAPLQKFAVGDDYDEVDRLCAACVERVAELTDFEGDFVSGLATRLGRYREKTQVTAKQVAKLREIARKLGFEE